VTGNYETIKSIVEQLEVKCKYLNIDTEIDPLEIIVEAESHYYEGGVTVEYCYYIEKDKAEEAYNIELNKYKRQLAKYKKELKKYEADLAQYEKEVKKQSLEKKRKMYEKLKEEFENVGDTQN
jgi:hypothetical protein